MILIILVLFLISPLFIYNLDISHNFKNHNDNKIHTSDVSGNDLYAERISTYIGGNKSLHKHSLLTNDTNILRKFDTSDPAFYKCNIFISASNGIQPALFPLPLTTRRIEENFATTFNSFSGFLYYGKDLSSTQAEQRAQRALEIIKRKFHIDIIRVNSSDGNFFPFIGYYPEWSVLLEELTTNIPKDGYWKAFDADRIMKTEYHSKNHLSISYALINNPDFFQEPIRMGNDQIDFNTGAATSPFLEVGGTQDTIDELTTILEENEDLFQNVSSLLGINETISDEDLEEITDNLSGFSMENDSHYAIIEVQYEGLKTGFSKVSQNEYIFELFDSLAYDEKDLEPSEKIYNNLMGASLSVLETNVLCSEITSITPKYSKFNSQLLDQLGLILYLANIDFDLETLENYSFELLFRDYAGLKRNYVNPVNLEDEFDIINFLPMLGFTGMDSYPGGILEPLEDYKLKYKIRDSEPNINLETQLIGENATYGAYREFDFNITAQNVGNETAWGVPTPIPITLDDIFPIMLYLEGGNPLYAEEFKDNIWTVVDNQYYEYDSLEEFFNFDKDPKIFSFDTFGDGATDYYSPNPLNITNLYPYNEKMNEVIDILASPGGYPTLIINLGISPDDLKSIFTNIYSVWNEENWKLESSEKISYISENYSIANLDSFTEFNSINFTIDAEENLPNIVVGDQYGSTTPKMALTNDNESWIILSEQEDLEQQVEIQFLASNETSIDLENHSIDRVSLEINLTDSAGGTQFEIFDFESEEFVNLQPYLSTIENQTRFYSIIKYNESINWIFNKPNQGDYTLLFRIRNQDSEQFNISIQNINIILEDRDINPYTIQSNLKHCSESENIRYYSYSNSITLSTENMASLVSYASITKNFAVVGEKTNYSLSIKNIGSETAHNISVEIPLPGIISNQKNFSIKDNHLLMEIEKLDPLDQVNIDFQFNIPNTGQFDETKIQYNSTSRINFENDSIKMLKSNPDYELFIASIDYIFEIPYLYVLDIGLNTSVSNPKINESFNITINIKNVAFPGSNISQINISMSDQYGDLERQDYGVVAFENILYHEIKSYNITLNKTDWKGYLYPAINFITNQDSGLIKIKNSNVLPLGFINFSITKIANLNEVEVGDTILINIEIKNEGTICIKNVNINDMLGFPQEGFSLIEGKLIFKINVLHPNQSLSFNYTIRANSQSLSTLQSASLEYYYLHQNTSYSNQLQIKVTLPNSTQYLFLLIPMSVALVLILSYGIYQKRRRQKMQEIQRNEMRILHLASRDSILKIDTSLKEFLTTNKTNHSLDKSSGSHGSVEVKK
ncbi:MAG: hypothetical protein BAJALOKI3v1_920004 [Promethearchaeota archaeon]|nr:MAG: hypothetical protein BAJALOKI3v1_920004 [Candidatus Lokiarchaeota archaeon]